MKCSVEGCDRAEIKRGMCNMHYLRYWRHRDVTKVNRIQALPAIKCSVEGCDEWIERISGMCEKHHRRIERNGTSDLINAPAGSGNVDSNGYYRIYAGGKQVYEHIHIAEKALGKPLPKGAIVHHVNEKPADNRNKNLVVCPNQEYHKLLHKRMKDLGITFDEDY
jgi:hypothetical protein